MVPHDRLLAFAVASLLIIVIPGPSLLFVVARALANGRRTAMLSAVGQELGAFVLVVAVALGVGSLMERSVLLFTVVKLAGAAYLVFLGVQAIARRRAHALSEAAAAPPGGVRAVRDGFVVGATNPKAAVFFAAVLPQFIDRASGHIPAQILVLGAVFVVIALACDMLWSVLAAGTRAWFARSPRRLELVGGTGGLAMIGLGVGVAVTGRKD